MIPVTPTWSLDEATLTWRFVRAPGPGGQNVNKVATAVELRCDTTAFPDVVRARLKSVAGRRLSADGALVLQARRFRSQERNRADALARLVALLQAAASPPKPRRPTRPTLASKQRRLESKRHRATIKNKRNRIGEVQ